jgi:hypothetical protein
MNRRSLLAVLGLLALIAAVVGGSRLPHVHTGQGLYNQEHDLTLLATSVNGAPLPDTGSIPVFIAVVAAVLPAAFAPPERSPLRYADLRAPPTV